MRGNSAPSYADPVALILTFLGIGLILFVHEAGHYLAARIAGVRVEVFSLGFGPRLFGKRIGATDYRLSLLPLGGYVRLAGEMMDHPPRPGELGAAGPGWRFLIFAGGILMNFLFALVVIPILFRIGVPFEAPVIGAVEAGSPAWHAGLQEGDRLASVNGRVVRAFRTFAASVALDDTPSLDIGIETPEGAVRHVQVEASYDPEVGFRRIGVAPAMIDPALRLEVAAEGAAQVAGLRSGDRLTAVDGIPVHRPLEARLLLEQALMAGGGITLRVEDREGRSKEVSLPPRTPAPEAPAQIGIRRELDVVHEVRPGPFADALQPGDRILRANDAWVQRTEDLAVACLRSRGELRLEVERDGVHIQLPPFHRMSPQTVLSQLWLDGGDSFRAAIIPRGPAAEAGIREGDLLLRVEQEPVRDLAGLARRIRAQPAGQALSFLVLHEGEEIPVELSVLPRPLPQPIWGFGLRSWQEVVRSKNVLEAVSMGLAEARGMVQEIGGTLRGMAKGSVSSNNLGGIITIGQLTHSFAAEGLVPLFFFLAMISIHLGVLNLLPIPALDGGHLLFVLIEKVRGRPLSDRTQAWFNLVGVAVILSLIFFVTFQDILRLTR